VADHYAQAVVLLLRRRLDDDEIPGLLAYREHFRIRGSPVEVHYEAVVYLCFLLLAVLERDLRSRNFAHVSLRISHRHRARPKEIAAYNKQSKTESYETYRNS